MPRSLRLLPVLVFFTLFYGQLLAETIYVNPIGSGNMSGINWTHSSNLQDALSTAIDGDNIWIASGNYFPGPFETDTFSVGENIVLIGGFGGFETMDSQADPVTYPTILSGDIGTPGLDTDNSDHVVTIAGNLVELVNLIIEEGHDTASYGSGVRAKDVFGFVMERCIIRNNVSTNGGGAGLYFENTIAPLTPPSLIINCVFENNETPFNGGGAYFYNNPGSQDEIINCVFINNRANWSGAGMRFSSSGYLIGCTFIGNEDMDGGAGTNEAGQLSFSEDNATPLIKNLIVVSATNTFDISSDRTGAATVLNIYDSIIGNPTIGTANSSDNTKVSFGSNVSFGGGNLFVNLGQPAGPDGIWMTQDDGFKLSGNASAIDIGSPFAPLTDFDILYSSRDANPDAGAYEYGAGGGGGPDLVIDSTFPVPPPLTTNTYGPAIAFILDTQNTGYNGNLIRVEYELQGANPNADFINYTLFNGFAGSNIFVNGTAATGNVIGGNVVFDNIWLPMTSSQNAIIGLFVNTPGSFVSDNVEFVVKPENIITEFAGPTGSPIFGGVATLAGNGGGNIFEIKEDLGFTPPATLERDPMGGNVVLAFEITAGANAEIIDGFKIDVLGDINDLYYYEIMNVTNSPYNVYGGNVSSGNQMSGNIDFINNPFAIVAGNTEHFELYVDINDSTSMDNVEFVMAPESIVSANTLSGNWFTSGVISFTGGGNITPPELVDDLGFTAPANLITSSGPDAVLIWDMDTENTGYNGTITAIQFDVFGADPGVELVGALVYDLTSANLVDNSPAFSANHITFTGLSWPLSSAGNSKLELKVSTVGSFSATNIMFDLQPSSITLADNASVTGTPISSGMINLDNGPAPSPVLKQDLGFSPPGAIGTNLFEEDVFAFELDSVGPGYSGFLNHLEIETFNADPSVEFTGFTLFDITMGSNVALGANLIGGNIVFSPINVALSGGSNTILALKVDTASSFSSDNIEFKLYPMGLGFSDNVMAQGNFVSYGPIALTSGNASPELSILPYGPFTPPGNIQRGTIDHIVMEFEIFGGANVEIIDGFSFETFSDVNDLTQFELIDVSGNGSLVYWGNPGTGNIVSGNIEFSGNPIVVMPGNTFHYELKVDVASSTATDNVDIVLNTWDVLLAGGNTVSGNEIDFGPIPLIGSGNVGPGPDLLVDLGFSNPGSIGTNLVEEGVFAFVLDTTSMGYTGNVISLEFDVLGADPNLEFTDYSLYDVSLASNIMGLGNVIAGNIVFPSLDIALSGGSNTIIELRVDSVG
jgi:hypothetical protein